MRKMGEILLELEALLDEMTHDHELQHGEVLALVNVWLTIHAPDLREEYTQGGNPEFYYGFPRRNKK